MAPTRSLSLSGLWTNLPLIDALWAMPFKLLQFVSQFLSHCRAFWAYLPFIVAICEPICFQLSHFWASLLLIVAACELSLTHSGSLWFFLVVSSSLWFPLAISVAFSGSYWLSPCLSLFLCSSLWLSVTPSLAPTGSHRHSLAYSGPLWLIIAL